MKSSEEEGGGSNDIPLPDPAQLVELLVPEWSGSPCGGRRRVGARPVVSCVSLIPSRLSTVSWKTVLQLGSWGPRGFPWRLFHADVPVSLLVHARTSRRLRMRFTHTSARIVFFDVVRMKGLPRVSGMGISNKTLNPSRQDPLDGDDNEMTCPLAYVLALWGSFVTGKALIPHPVTRSDRGLENTSWYSRRSLVFIWQAIST